MNKYKIKFNGQLKGAIGQGEHFTLFIEAENARAATLKVYDTHEHIAPGATIQSLPDGKEISFFQT